MSPVILDPVAITDLSEIGAYIARDNPVRARSFVEELRAVCLRCGQFPRSARFRSDWGDGVYIRAHGGYLVIYTFDGESVLIRRVVHGSRDLRRLIGKIGS